MTPVYAPNIYYQARKHDVKLTPYYAGLPESAILQSTQYAKGHNVWISSNGYMTFNEDESTYYNNDYVGDSEGGQIAPFWWVRAALFGPRAVGLAVLSWLTGMTHSVQPAQRLALAGI